MSAMITAIFVMMAVCSVGHAAAPMGTVNGELFMDNQCTQPFVTITTNWTEADVAMDGSQCQAFTVDGFSYSNIIKCSNDVTRQYYNEQFWPNTQTCSGAPLWTFSHVGPVGACNEFSGTNTDRTEIFTAYSKLICTADANNLLASADGTKNSAAAMTYNVMAILSSIVMLLLTLA